MSSPTVGPVFTVISSAIPTGASPGGGGGGGGGGQTSGNTSLANSASLYLYTFLATLVLLLSVSGAIVVRSFILRRRNRRMVEEAIRNGTWVPPAPAVRPARVDLSQKPELWEAHLGDGGWQLGSSKELDNWKLDYSRDWESIKPLSAGYAASVPYSGSTLNHTSLSPPVYTPAPTPMNPSAPRGDDEEHGTTPSLLSRAARARRIFLNPMTSTLPASSTANNRTNAHSNSNNISLTELSSSSPTTVRVAVLIAMPSSSSHGSSITPLSASFPSSQAQPTTSHTLHSSPSPTVKVTDDEELPLPHLEMGVADVLIRRSENSSTSDSAHTGKKAIYSRGNSYAES